MKLRYLGYACTNVTLNETTGRTLRLSNLSPERALAVSLANLDALERILSWNVEQGIFMFRVSSSVIPFASHPDHPFLWQSRLEERFEHLRQLVARHNIRLSMHPGQYTVLNSPREDVVQRSLAEINYQAQFLQAIAPGGGDVVLHLGGAYGDKAAAVERFARNFQQLSPAAQHQLVLENDDTVYALDEVLPLCERLGLAMVFDIFHHRCHPGRDDWREGLDEHLEAIVGTWKGRTPKFHISSQRPDAPRGAHADLIEHDDLDRFCELMGEVDGPRHFDLMVEAKLKDRAVLDLLGYLGLRPPREESDPLDDLLSDSLS